MNTTPDEISEEILKFCKEIDPTTEPTFLEFSDLGDYESGDCHNNVDKHIAEEGGSFQRGWMIWLEPKVLLNAEFHSVWINREGKYVDLTPRVDKEERILFLPDSKKKFNGEFVANIIKILNSKKGK